MSKTSRIDKPLSEAKEGDQDATGLAATAQTLAGIDEGDLPPPPEPPEPPTPPAPAPEAAAPADAAPAPLWAPHEHIPHEGGSFVRQSDGSLTRTEEEA